MKYFLASIFLLLLFTGCDDENETRTTIYPLTIGNRWVYDIIVYDTAGVITDRSTSTLSVWRDTLINNETWYFVGPLETYGEYITNREDGQYAFSMNFATQAPEPRLVNPYPAAIGRTRVFRDTVPGANAVASDSLFVARIDSLMATPAGTFICYHYQKYRLTEIESTIMSQWRSDALYAPNVGLVYQADYITPKSGREYRGQETILKRLEK